MPFLLVDGCWGRLSSHWTSSNIGYSGANGRSTGQGAIRTQNNGSVSRLFPTSYTHMTAGFAFLLEGLPSGSQTLCSFDESGVGAHFQVYVSPTGVVHGARNSTIIGSTSAVGLVVPNRWYHGEVDMVVHDTTGSFEIRVDEVSVAGGTNVDTRNAGSGTVNQFRIAPQGGLMQRWTDIFVTDGTEGWLGDHAVAKKVLNANDTINSLNELGAAGSYAKLIDENGATYNEFSAVALDKYLMAALNLTSTIKAVAVSPRGYKTDAGAVTARAALESGGVRANGDTYTLPTNDIDLLQQVFPLDPNTGAAWTTAALDAMKLIFERLT